MRRFLPFLLLLVAQTVLAEPNVEPNVETIKGKPSPGVPACPTKDPCVVYYDGAYVIHARSWNRYYAVLSDPVTVIPAQLAALRVKHAKLSCGIYLYARALTGSGPTLEVAVPKRAPGTAIEKRPVSELVTEWNAIRRAGPPHPTRPNEPLLSALFSASEQAALTKDSFEHPTLRAFWLTGSSGDTVKELRAYLLFSPESADAYLLVDRVEYPRSERIADRPARAFDSIATTLAAIGAKTVQIDARDACSFRDLLPNGGWVDYRR